MLSLPIIGAGETFEQTRVFYFSVEAEALAGVTKIQLLLVLFCFLITQVHF